MNTPEGHVKKCVKKLLKSHVLNGQTYVHWPVQTGYGAPTLDCVGADRGRPFAIETKGPGQVLTVRQEVTKNDMEKAGYRVFIIGQVKLGEGDYSGMGELAAWLLLHS